MYAGLHHQFAWEIADGHLIISADDAKIGELKRQVVHNRFNNAEQATWFAQGQIDTALAELETLYAEKSA